MTARGRGYSQSQDWDSTRDDYNSSMYDPQYADDSVSGGVQLDHCRLYITNIPRALNDEGLKAAFSKYGTLVEVYLNKDPLKKYGLVKFETPGEAKLAMMKMNRTEPLRLNVSVAHKTKGQDARRRTDGKQERMNTNGTRERNIRDDNSVSSRGKHSRKQDEMTSCDEVDDGPVDDDFGFPDTIDPNLHLELENLKLEQLKIKEEQLMCKHRMILLKQADKKSSMQNSLINRCILPDGKIVVRNVDRAAESRDPDVSYGAGAGDSHKIPALQSVGSRQCVSCGRAAAAYCAGCGVTPYCGEQCQRRDWADRHRAVCHNLARLNAGKERDIVEPDKPVDAVAPAAPLRPPHEDSGSDRTQKKFNNRPNTKGASPRHNFVPKRAPELRRPNIKQDATAQDDEDWTPKKSESSPNTPSEEMPAKMPQSLSTVAKLVKPGRSDFESKPSRNDFEAKSTRSDIKTTPPRRDVDSKPARSNFEEKAVTKPARIEPESKPVRKEPEPPKIETAKEVTPLDKKTPPNAVSAAANLMPKTYLIETLSVGDSVVLSVDSAAAECRSTRSGFVCLSMNEKYEADYQKLCESYGEACEALAGDYKLVPGETCSYFDAEDGGWYRARCLTPTILALLDASKLATVTSSATLAPLPQQYQAIPEFCCLLQADGIQVGVNVTCKLISKTADGYKVSIVNNETAAVVGEGEVFRWVPTVDYPAPKPVIPEVDRPSVTNNGRVVLVHATAMDKVYVRSADEREQRRYDDVVEQVALHGRTATPLKEPPVKGQVVLGMFEDLHYRALCKRTNVKQNKYLLEYIEFGNVEISPLENIFPCPKDLDLSSIPALVSHVKLYDTDAEFTPAALEYIEKLKDDSEELILTLPSGQKTAASGAVVSLVVSKNNESVNKKLADMCTPDWKKIEERGGDVVETVPMMYSDVEYLELCGSCELAVIDAAMLECGVLSGHPQGLPHADYVANQLANKIAAYCNSELGRKPYLPQVEELCIAQCPPGSEWQRAVLMEQIAGAGGDTVRLYFLDRGNMATVPVAKLRKMLPEFVKGLPVLALHLEIIDFPKEVTPAMLQRAREHLKLNDKGRGTLRITNCEMQELGLYKVEAPSLIAAITQ